MIRLLTDLTPCHTAAHRGWVHPPEQGDLLELLGVNG